MMNLTVVELRAKAKELGMKGYSKLNKADLIKAIETFTAQNKEVKEVNKQDVNSTEVKKNVIYSTTKSKKVVRDNNTNTRKISGKQAKFLLDIYLDYDVVIPNAITTAEQASKLLDSLICRINKGEIAKRKSSVPRDKRPTLAQITAIVSHSDVVTIKDLPKTKFTASKIIAVMMKETVQDNPEQLSEVAVTKVNEEISTVQDKIETLTDLSKKNKPKFLDTLTKYFRKLFRRA